MKLNITRIKQDFSFEDASPAFLLLGKALALNFILNFCDLAFHICFENYLAPPIWTLNFTILGIFTGILLLPNHILRSLFGFVFLLPMLAQHMHFSYFGSYVQPISFYMLAGNFGEIFNALQGELKTLLPSFGIFLFAGISTFFILNIERFKTSFRSTTHFRVGALLLVLVFIFNALRSWDTSIIGDRRSDPQLRRALPIPKLTAHENFFRSVGFFTFVILPQKLASTPLKKFESLDPPTIKKVNPNINVIFIIGETMRAKQLSILGYTSFETTPKLKSLPSLFATSIYSAGTTTKTAVSALLNRIPYPGMVAQIAEQKNCVFRLAKANGFKTYFFSAQSNESLYLIRNYMCQKYIDVYEDRSSYEEKNPGASPYDDVLQEMIKNIDFNAQNNFVILHQRGSHVVYEDQYPKKFQRSKSNYNNSILFSDTVIHDLIKDIESQTQKKTYVLMTSDHGELLGEHGKKGHGWFFPEVYRVPFLFYAIHDEGSSIPLKNVQSHFQLTNLITQLLGYDIAVKKIREVYINGTDVDGLAGYMIIKLDENGQEVSSEEFR